MALFTFGLFFIEIIINLLLRQRGWLPFEVAMSLEARETVKLQKKINSFGCKTRGRKFA